MSTTVVKPVPFRRPPTTAQSRRRAGRRRPLALAVIAVTVATVGAGTWLIVGLVAGSGANALSAPITAPAWTPTAMPLAERGQVLGLQRQLVLAGYAIKVDGNLDRVARSALADYLRPNEAHPLTPFVASVLGGTVITGLRNPSVWNRRFGPHPTTLVELAPYVRATGRRAYSSLRTSSSISPERASAPIGRTAPRDPRPAPPATCTAPLTVISAPRSPVGRSGSRERRRPGRTSCT